MAILQTVTGAALTPTLRRIGDVAEVTGLTSRTIRYYEELGLLNPAAHVSGANRRYDEEDVERLLLIKRLREVVGLSLADVKTFLETETERRALSREYHATTDPIRRTELLDRVEPILVRRVRLLEHKLESVHVLLDEERARLDRVAALRDASRW
jgi:MerR family transcriptional regulator, repressor of the yfmOP operon